MTYYLEILAMGTISAFLIGCFIGWFLHEIKNMRDEE